MQEVGVVDLCRSGVQGTRGENIKDSELQKYFKNIKYHKFQNPLYESLKETFWKEQPHIFQKKVSFQISAA
jgi:hypothetical protein